MKGRYVAAFAAQLLEIAFVLELLRCGLTPERPIAMVRTWWDWIRRAFLTARDHDHPVIIAFLQGDFVALDRSRDEDKPLVNYTTDGCAIIGLDPKDGQEQLRATLKTAHPSASINTGKLPHQAASTQPRWIAERQLSGSQVS